MVTAVDREVVRKEFYASWPADGEDEKKRANAKRQAFSRAEITLLDRKKIQTREIGSRMMVWALDDQKVDQP